MTATKKLRVGIIGGGMIAKAHVIALRALRSYFGEDRLDADVVAVADVTQEAASQAAQQYSIERWTTDWQGLLADDSIDAITIATPNFLHAEHAIVTVEAGKHVMCEKPLAHTIEAARLMVDAAERAGVVNSVNFNYRCIPAIRYARKLIAAGDLGEILSVRGAFLQDWGADPQVSRSWKFEASRGGAGPILTSGCHVIDLIRYVTGHAIVELAAAANTVIKERPLPSGRNTYATSEGPAKMAPVDVEDVGAFVARLDNGAIGTLEASRVASGRSNFCFLEVNGSQGSVVFDYETLNELQVWTSRSKGFGFNRVLVGPSQDGGLFWTLGGLGVGFAETITLHMREFVTAIIEGRPAEPAFRDGLHAQEVAFAALRSAASGAWESVPKVLEN
ncbi:MAG: Gfo/Idh/MocA family oxidoreductase [Propionibacteriaceae bacterium]|nr:Gfo/Idh/MocA family oxidoreductase [Propionibacteriaceae bacterium]